MRRSPKVAEVLPVLYLRGLSTGDFRAVDVLNELLGLELVAVDREQGAGTFKVDLVAEGADGQPITYLVAIGAKWRAPSPLWEE
jgi:hypothetical protein